jgi:hypothetical protein
MPIITNVEAMNRETLSVDLAGGHALMLPVALLLSLPDFSSLAEDDRILYPHTDGECVYWNHGPKISLSEIIALLDEIPEAEKSEITP